jgi:hypothetical protein
MARTGQNENTQANQQYSAEQQQAFNTGQAANTKAISDSTAQQKATFDAGQREVGAFDRNISTLDKGGQVAANPWQSAGYLANVNKLQSGALNSEENAGKEELQRNNLRTGGLNSGATIGATKGLALNKMRLGEQLSAERSAGDFNKNVDYQQVMARAPLEGAGATSPYFAGATSGRDAALGNLGGYFGSAVGGQSGALKNLTDYGIASYGPWNSVIKGSLEGAGTGAGIAACWIAEVIYGVDDPRTHLLRSWLNDEFKRTRVGRVVMAVYVRFGERIAAQAAKHSWLRAVLRPWFNLALDAAITERTGKVVV